MNHWEGAELGSGKRLTVSVALLSTETFGPFWVRPSARVPHGTLFSELPSTKVEAAEDESLRAVLGRAGESIGVQAMDMDVASALMNKRRLFAGKRTWQDVKSDPRTRDPGSRFEDTLYFAAFFQSGDDDGVPAVITNKRLNLRRLTVVSDEGAARWNVKPLDATLAELVRAADAGFLQGDPLRPYLVLSLPGGDPGSLGADWSVFLDALKIFAQAVIDIGSAWAGFEALKAVKARFQSAQTVVEERHSDWATRGARPRDLEEIFAAQPRQAEEVATLLKCPIGEAESLLWGMGFVLGEDGLWRAGDDSPTRVLKLARELPNRTESVSIDGLRVEIESLTADPSAPSPADDKES
jgi:hypothetical protein